MLRISNTNGNSRQSDAVRVYDDNVLIAVVFPKKRNPLSYIQKHDGKYRASLVQQLLEYGVNVGKINSLLGIRHQE